MLVVLPLALAIVGLVVALGPDTPSAQQPPQKVVFALNWFPVGDHAAYWVALEKGYYRQRGLDVDMQNSKGSGDSIAKVDTGRADIGLADSAVVIASSARGTKIKVVGMVFDKSPLNFWSRKDAPITKPKDLEGKTVAAPPGRRAAADVPRLRAAARHRPEQGHVGERGAGGQGGGARPRSGWTRWPTTPPACRSTRRRSGKGNAVMLPWADHGFDMYSMSIIASEKTMKERGPVLKAFLEASYLGWRDVMADPKSALEIFKKRVPEIDLSIIEPNMMMGLDLMKTDRYAKNGIGWMEEKKMCDSVDLVNTYMGVPTKVECKAVYTNEFLTKVELPRSAR